MIYVGIALLLLFLFIVNMVLSNLIIALAVDINKEGTSSKIKAIKFVMARIEELEHVFLFLKKWKCKCNYMTRMQNWNLISRLCNLGIGAKYSYRISFFPNRPKDRFSIYLRCMLTPTNNTNNEKNMIYLTAKPTYFYYVHKTIYEIQEPHDGLSSLSIPVVLSETFKNNIRDRKKLTREQSHQ